MSIFALKKVEVIIYPSGTFSLCSCEQKEVPYLHACVCAQVLIPEGQGFGVKMSTINTIH